MRACVSYGTDRAARVYTRYIGARYAISCICVQIVNLGFVGLDAPAFVYLRCQRDGPARERHTRPCGRLVAHIMFNTYTFTNGSKTYKRVTKKTARRLHNEGVSLVVVACNLRPFTPWHCEGVMSADDEFDTFVNSYTYYNCTNETGYYPSYYVAQ